jgi:hypothetical protein
MSVSESVFWAYAHEVGWEDIRTDRVGVVNGFRRHTVTHGCAWHFLYIELCLKYHRDTRVVAFLVRGDSVDRERPLIDSEVVWPGSFLVLSRQSVVRLRHTGTRSLPTTSHSGAALLSTGVVTFRPDEPHCRPEQGPEPEQSPEPERSPEPEQRPEPLRRSARIATRAARKSS